MLTGLDDENLAIKAVRDGAQDYLVKGSITGPTLARSIRYAIERREIELELRKYQDHLEDLVEDRTVELKAANEWLQVENADRKKAEQRLQESEALLRAIIQSIQAGIAVIDIDTSEIIEINPVALQMLGDPKEAVIGSCYDRYFVDSDVSLTVGSTQSTTSFLVNSDGNRIPILQATVTRSLESRKRAIISFIDLTERNLLEQERLRSQKLESLGTLAGGIAHDFNNILLAIFSNISLAKLDIDPNSEAFEAIEDAERVYSRIKALTQQLLTYAKGGYPIKEVIFINHLLRETAEFALSGSNVKPIFSISDALWPINVDSDQIGQIVHNLVLNAHQALPTGGVVEIKGENFVLGSNENIPGGKKNSKWIKITIKDTGSGIPENHLEKIFDPYFSTKHEGRGLGLATVYSILKNHDGHIEVKSKEGVGTTFIFYLPASDKELVKSEVAESTEPSMGDGRVLLMDDDEMLLSIISRLLVHQGYKVKCARDGLEAIEMYKQAIRSGQPYDAVVMDLVVPNGMGGKESMQKLVEIDPDIKAIVSSGYSNDPVMADHEKYGFCGVLPKPYRIRELAALIQEVSSGIAT